MTCIFLSALVIASAVDFIKQYEGYSSVPYKDMDGSYKCGYGFDCRGKKTYTREEADKELRRVVEEQFAKALQRNCKNSLTHNQSVAILSFSYNLGVSGTLRSDVWKFSQKGMHVKAAQSFKLYVRSGGKIIKGLVKRREAEMKLYKETSEL